MESQKSGLDPHDFANSKSALPPQKEALSTAANRTDPQAFATAQTISANQTSSTNQASSASQTSAANQTSSTNQASSASQISAANQTSSTNQASLASQTSAASAPAGARPITAWDFFAVEESLRRRHGDFFDCAPARTSQPLAPANIAQSPISGTSCGGNDHTDATATDPFASDALADQTSAPQNLNTRTFCPPSPDTHRDQEHEQQQQEPGRASNDLTMANFAGFPCLPPGNSECTEAAIETNVTVDCLIPAARRVSIIPPSYVRPDWTGIAKLNIVEPVSATAVRASNEENLRKLAILRESLKSLRTPSAAQTSDRPRSVENDPFANHRQLSFTRQRSGAGSLFEHVARPLSLQVGATL